MKNCRDCGEYKAIELFVKNRNFASGIDNICTNCNREKVREYYKNKPKTTKGIKRPKKFKSAHDKHLNDTYGIREEDYTWMFDNQKGCCAICNKHQIEFKKRLSVDHCHMTGNIRKLLCQPCNLLLGRANDNPEILQKAIEYLKEFKETT